MYSMFGNNPRELAIAVFNYLDSIKKKVDIEKGFALYILIDEFLEWNLPTDGSNYQKQKDEEIYNIIDAVRLYFTSNEYFKIIKWENDNLTVKLTEKGLEAKRCGGIDKYEEKIKNEEELAQLQKESLQASVKANEIAVKANGISSRAIWISLASAVITLLGVLYSFYNNDSKQIDHLNTEVVLIKKKQLEDREGFLKTIDSLSSELTQQKNINNKN